MNLRLDPGLLEQVIDHAQAIYPREGCGLLAGRGSLATRFIPMVNTCASETAYEMDPVELINSLRELRLAGEELVAVYHSHPRGPSYPSASDIRRAYYPEVAHVIVSLSDRKRPQAAAFRIIDGKVLEIELHAIV